nr:RNA-directed DNA polymerase, eukaryota, reverse transcriptase zinc-binding domain protein [Tanacetum cinerariifolium]
MATTMGKATIIGGMDVLHKVVEQLGSSAGKKGLTVTYGVDPTWMHKDPELVEIVAKKKFRRAYLIRSRYTNWEKDAKIAAASFSQIFSQFVYLGSKKQQVMVFKVDFAKGYNSIRWDYLDDVLRAFGFGSKWRSWIGGSLRSGMASILLNGSPTSEFQFHCGLKQGDPLAPYLCILIMESLYLSFSRAVDDGIFKGIKINSSLTVSHLFMRMMRFLLESDRRQIFLAWDEVIGKLKARLSKWKLKTLSVEGISLMVSKSMRGISRGLNGP